MVRSRDDDAGRRREESARRKDVLVPKCADRKRRARLEADDEKWLRYYFHETFWYEFTAQQREMIGAVRKAIEFGGDQSIAASRGEGKTTLCECLLLKFALSGVVSFAVLCAATRDAATLSLEAIKSAIAENDRLCEDYPEICVPVRALENTPNRAHYQTVSGHRHDNGEPYARASSAFTWCGQEVTLPAVPGAPAAKAIIATRGLDSAIRGLKKKGRRPQVVLIDDPDTEATAESAEQAIKLEKRIDRAIGGLGGQQRTVARVMITTLQSRICVSYKFTDPKQKPTWKGKRFRFLLEPPERADLWEEYVDLVKANMQAGDEFARGAYAFYVARRAEMDAGALVANPNRFDDTELPDGTPKELSALQHYYNQVAAKGPEAVATEYDNDPPEESAPVESGITATRIQLRLSGYPRRIVPPGCKVLVQGMDMKKAGGHWVVRAWQPDATNFTTDYGFHESHGTRYGSDEGVELAMLRVVHERMEEIRANPYTTADGEIVDVQLTLVDAGWQADAIYAACEEIGLGIYPAKGHGKSEGCATPNFRPVSRASRDRKPGDGWFLSRIRKQLWLVNCDADRWKAFEHARWLTDRGKPGAAYIFGDMTDDERKYLDQRMPRDAKEHHAYAHHVTAETEVEEFVKGALVRRFKKKAGRTANHWGDASYLCDVAAAMCGIRLLGRTSFPQEAKQKGGWFASQDGKRKRGRDA